MNDFIGIYPDALNAEMCDWYVEHMKNMNENTATLEAGFIINDKHIFREDTQFFLSNTDRKMNGELNQFLQEVVQQYRESYPILNDMQLVSYDNKMQTTKIGGGYHLWHCEQSMPEMATRVLTWSIYLNDVEEGGETEFLYQHKRIKATKGTVVIFPASFTHTHRGNPPLSNEKYIATGWFHLT